MFYLPSGTIINVPSNRFTAMPCRTCCQTPELVGLQAEDISAPALCASGAMVLLCAQVDPLLVQLIGWWKPDRMLQYLHLQATNMHNLVTCMLLRGEFKLIPI